MLLSEILSKLQMCKVTNFMTFSGGLLIYVMLLILICYSASPLLGHHALAWMIGFRMAGFMLSGSGIRVFVLGNMGLGWGGWGKVQVKGGGVVGTRFGGLLPVIHYRQL